MSRSRTGNPGWFITLEGPEGAGKTTLANGLAQELADRGLDAALTREPGGTWLGERIRDVILGRTEVATRTDPLTDALLFNAARRQLVTESIAPSLAAGRTVICARYTDSTLAYQGYGSGLPLDQLRDLATLATDDLEPDLTLLLDVPVEVGLARKTAADQTRFEAEFDLGFHRRVRDGFLELAARDPARFVIIDATRPSDAVLVEALDAVTRSIGPGEPKPAMLRTTG